MNGTYRLLLASAALAAALCGCAATEVRPNTPNTPPRQVNEKNYTLGSEMTAYVGQAIARVKQYQINYEFKTGLRLPVSLTLTAKSGGQTHTIPAGTEFKNLRPAVYDEEPCYVIDALPPTFHDGKPVIYDNGEFDGLLMSAGGTIYTQCKKGPICATPQFVELKPFQYEAESVVPNGQNFELLYSGASKDQINLQYREYTPDDMARPAFSQNLTYDRASSSIRFRDMQIRVLEASNESLRYVIEADGLGAE